MSTGTPSKVVVYFGPNFILLGRWVAKLVARLLAKAANWVRIQTSLKNKKWAT